VEPLSDAARALIDGKNFGTVATRRADGSAQLSVVWVTRDGNDLLFSTLAGRAKPRNLSRDPRVSVIVAEADNPYRYVEIRGQATLGTEGGRELIDDLNEKYRGTRPHVGDSAGDMRVVVRLSPDYVRVYG
jgi:PPOX class probable F420-dependent enzyme